MNQTLDRFVSLLFPKGCVLCGDVVAYDDFICPRCQPDKMEGMLCEACGKPAEHCACRLDYSWAFDRAVSALYYRGETRGALLRLKKVPDPRITAFLAAQMKEAFDRTLSGISFDFVTEVPMHPGKQKVRGYNQAELLAAGIARMLAIPHRMRLLACSGEEVFQHSLNREERFASVAGRYHLNIPQAGARILLVDDIMTTGATLDACSRSLKAGGAAYVAALTAAGTGRATP